MANGRYDLPTDYDVIVLGTGMVECIFAAASARIGKSVLHLDRNGYYGGDWASFNLDQFQKLLKGEESSSESDLKAEPKAENVDLKDGESLLTCSNLKTIHNVSEKIYIKLSSDLTEKIENVPDVDLVKESETESKCETHPETDKESSNEMKTDAVDGISSSKIEKPDADDSHETNKAEIEVNSEKEEPVLDLCWEDIYKQYRKFNLDISPKLLFSRGELVELLISSNVAKYAEYKCLTRVLTYTDKLVQVPCSRSDVFSTKHISVIDKRMLMKLMSFILEYDFEAEENVELKSQQFGDFLKKRKLSESVCHYVINAIAMVPANTKAEEGLRAAKKFMSSLGRFGNTPFLWPMYGCGEIPQCFCRLCAVFGGIYFLRRCAESIITDGDKQCRGIVSEGQRFNCKVLMLDSTYAPTEYIPENIKDHKVSRAILITKDSLIPATKEQLSLLRLPSTKSHNTISLLELPPGSMVCPEGMHVVYLTSESLNETSEEDLKETVNKFFNSESKDKTSEKPLLIWSAFFNLIDTTKCELNSKTPENIFIASNSGIYLDFDHAVIEARKLFSKAFPESEFLPRAPDPEEIILDDGEPSDTKGDVCESEENTLEDKDEKLPNDTQSAVKEDALDVIPENLKPTDENIDKSRGE